MSGKKGQRKAENIKKLEIYLKKLDNGKHKQGHKLQRKA